MQHADLEVLISEIRMGTENLGSRGVSLSLNDSLSNPLADSNPDRLVFMSPNQDFVLFTPKKRNGGSSSGGEPQVARRLFREQDESPTESFQSDEDDELLDVFHSQLSFPQDRHPPETPSFNDDRVISTPTPFRSSSRLPLLPYDDADTVLPSLRDLDSNVRVSFFINKAESSEYIERLFARLDLRNCRSVRYNLCPSLANF